MSTLDQIGTHLQFLGYDVTTEGDLVKAVHRSKPNILLRPYRGGVLLTSIYGCESYAKRKKGDYLTFINSVNESASVVRYYADKDSDFFIEAWYPDAYDRTSFGVFLELWDRDMLTLVNHSEVTKFLK